jgi:hypothetical protein
MCVAAYRQLMVLSYSVALDCVGETSKRTNCTPLCADAGEVVCICRAVTSPQRTRGRGGQYLGPGGVVTTTTARVAVASMHTRRPGGYCRTASLSGCKRVDPSGSVRVLVNSRMNVGGAWLSLQLDGVNSRRTTLFYRRCDTSRSHTLCLSHTHTHTLTHMQARCLQMELYSA